jgi:hypothetical protein
VRKVKPTNPFDGRPGFWNRINRFLYPIAGPAQLGAGHPEERYVAPVNPQCPVCGRPMEEHHVRRGDARTPTRINCPT